MSPTELTIIIPVYNDTAALRQLLQRLLPLQCEIVIAAVGNSELPELPDRVRWLCCPRPSRGAQIARAAAVANGPWLWVLHADSRFEQTLVDPLWALSEPAWGRFDVRLDSPRLSLRWVSIMMNCRSRVSAICTGDQGMFVHTSLLHDIGGMPEQPLMEDIELSKRLKRLQRPICLPGLLYTSARRWEHQGVWRTVVSMWGLRLRYWRGASPESLALRYYGEPK